jgi:hypothetical protein
MKINKSILGVAGEYYVAAELGKRNIYAQLTLGNQKRTDLLIFSEDNGKLLKVEVKCKQGLEWPNCKGIFQQDTYIVFVDFKDIQETQRPDFYILNTDDWKKLVINKEREYKVKFPDRKTKIENNVLVLLSEKNNQGKPYLGCGIKPKDIEQFKERWDKISDELIKTTNINGLSSSIGE